jgi:hypothetical protein
MVSPPSLRDDDLGNSLKITRGNNNNNPPTVIDWQQFHQFLIQRTNSKTAGGRLRYARKFERTLYTGDAQPLLQLSPDKRIHAMKALAALSRFLGCYDAWLAIRQRYNLKWSTGNESLAAFERFFDDKRTLDSMLQWVRDAIRILPAPMGAIIKFNCLTGLRPNEAIQAVRLLNNGKAPFQYYNPQLQVLEHFRHPQIFLRRTKSAYISLITKEQLSAIGILDCKTPTTPSYVAVQYRLARSSIGGCHLGYCRKIFGSWLRQNGGIASETVDLLQGRVPKTVFARNYFTPSVDYRQKVLEALEQLQKQL